jgi:hypothetical protein
MTTTPIRSIASWWPKPCQFSRLCDPSRIGAVRRALQHQRDDLLAFAGVLDDKLAAIARAAAIPDDLVRATCLLHRKPDTSGAFWQGWNRLHAAMGPSRGHGKVGLVILNYIFSCFSLKRARKSDSLLD